MNPSIPASLLVSVLSGVLPAGGNELAFNGLVLSEATVLPTGAPTSFPTAAAVATYFGQNSLESEIAGVYFAGFQNSVAKPSSLSFARYANVALSGFMRAGAMGLTLAQLQALTPASLTLTVDGVAYTDASLDLSTATSFSDAATKIHTGTTMGAAGTVTWDPNFQAFVVTSATTGNTSLVAFATGAMAAELGMTQATGAVTSAGQASTTPAAFMNTLTGSFQAFVCFMTAFEPVLTDKEAFATWTSLQNAGASGARFAYCAWDTDATAATEGPSSFTGFGNWLATNPSVSGTALFWKDPLEAAFAMGWAASQDFTQPNTRLPLAYCQNPGLAPNVFDATSAENLWANGYNFYGQFATAAQIFTFVQKGTISGPYSFFDEFIVGVAIAQDLQLQNMLLLANPSFIPYNSSGKAKIQAAGAQVAKKYLGYGGIQAGIALTDTQIAEVNARAGLPTAASDLQKNGWLYLVGDASGSARQARTSPPCTFFYVDGGSVQSININAITVR